MAVDLNKSLNFLTDEYKRKAVYTNIKNYIANYNLSN